MLPADTGRPRGGDAHDQEELYTTERRLRRPPWLAARPQLKTALQSAAKKAQRMGKVTGAVASETDDRGAPGRSGEKPWGKSVGAGKSSSPWRPQTSAALSTRCGGPRVTRATSPAVEAGVGCSAATPACGYSSRRPQAASGGFGLVGLMRPSGRATVVQHIGVDVGAIGPG